MARLRSLTDQKKTGISLRQISRKFTVGISTIHRHLKAMGMVYRRKKRAPKYADQQLQEIPKGAARFCRTLEKGRVELILDDEKYFSLHNDSISTNRGFYTSNPSIAPPEVKFEPEDLRMNCRIRKRHLNSILCKAKASCQPDNLFESVYHTTSNAIRRAVSSQTTSVILA